MTNTAGLALGYSSILMTLTLMCVAFLTINKNKSSYIVWHFISWIYLVKWYPLLNISVSSTTASLTNSFITSFYPFSIFTYSNPSSIPTSFTVAGITNPYFLNNLGPTLVIWGLSLLIYLVITLLRCSKFDQLRRAACENLIIRSTLIFFSEFCIFSFLQIMEFEVSTSYGLINSILAVAVMIALFLAMCFLTFNVHYRMREKSEEAIVRFQTLLDEFKKDSFKQWLYYTLFMVERIIIAAALTFFNGMIIVQAFALIFCHMAKMAYVLIVRPFSNKIDNFIVGGFELLSVMIVALMVTSTSSQISNSNEDDFIWGYFAIVIFANAIVCVWFTVRVMKKDPDAEVQNLENAENGEKVEKIRSGEGGDDSFNHTILDSSDDKKIVRNVSYKSDGMKSAFVGAKGNDEVNKKESPFGIGGRRDDGGRNGADGEIDRNESRKSAVKPEIRRVSKIMSVYDLAENIHGEAVNEKAGEINERIPYYNSLLAKYINQNK